VTDYNNHDNSIIPVSSSNIVNVGSSISILNKILYGSISALFNKAFCKLNSKQTLSIDRDYLYLLETNPTHRKYAKYKYLANSDDDYREALAIFTEVLKIKPKHILSIEMGAICKKRLGNVYEAIEDYSKAIEIDNNYSSAYNGRGVAKDDLNDYQGAIEDYSKAIEIDPKFGIAYYNRGIVKADLKDYQGAIEDYSRAIEIDPKDAHAYGNRGIVKYPPDQLHMLNHLPSNFGAKAVQFG
jgi:tetratricopeptide (TPR) repeat protein